MTFPLVESEGLGEERQLGFPERGGGRHAKCEAQVEDFEQLGCRFVDDRPQRADDGSGAGGVERVNEGTRPRAGATGVETGEHDHRISTEFKVRGQGADGHAERLLVVAARREQQRRSSGIPGVDDRFDSKVKNLDSVTGAQFPQRGRAGLLTERGHVRQAERLRRLGLVPARGVPAPGDAAVAHRSAERARRGPVHGVRDSGGHRRLLPAFTFSCCLNADPARSQPAQLPRLDQEPSLGVDGPRRPDSPERQLDQRTVGQQHHPRGPAQLVGGRSEELAAQLVAEPNDPAQGRPRSEQCEAAEFGDERRQFLGGRVQGLRDRCEGAPAFHDGEPDRAPGRGIEDEGRRVVRGGPEVGLE